MHYQVPEPALNRAMFYVVRAHFVTEEAPSPGSSLRRRINVAEIQRRMREANALCDLIAKDFGWPPGRATEESTRQALIDRAVDRGIMSYEKDRMPRYKLAIDSEQLFRRCIFE